MIPGRFLVNTSPDQAGSLDVLLNFFADDLQTGFETVLCFVPFMLLFDLACMQHVSLMWPEVFFEQWL
jgi:hypothetical protein